MLTRMTDQDWEIVVQVFRSVRSRRGGKGRNDRKFLEALHFFRSTTSRGGHCQLHSGTGTRSGSASGA